jgi:hypothetical protein
MRLYGGSGHRENRETREFSEIENSSGDTLRVGDIITAYRKGYHVIARITQEYVDGAVSPYYEEHNVHYRQVCDHNGVLSRHAKIEHECASSYCRPAQNAIDYMRKRADTIEATLNAYKESKKP